MEFLTYSSFYSKARAFNLLKGDCRDSSKN
jgi:hypothetical protein